MKIASTISQMAVRELASFFLKRDFLNKYKNTEIQEEKQVVRYIEKKHKLPLFPYEDLEKYNSMDIEVFKDEECGLYYTLYKGKRMYLSSKFKSKWHARRYIRNLYMEQDEHSPHRYLTSSFNVDPDSIIYDIGGAEGIFALDNIEKSKKIYIFECDLKWIQALKKTFAPYGDKVEIINKFISDTSGGECITIDDFTKEHNAYGKVDFIKMDIEGYEEAALKGAKKTLENQKDLKLVSCIYHLSGQSESLKKYLTQYENAESDGYMIFYYDYNIKNQYLRHGVLRSKKCS